MAEDILSSPANIPDGARAGWTITAPCGATITAISYYRTLASHVDTELAAGLYLTERVPLEQCRIATPFGSPIVCSMPNNQVPVWFANLSATSLFFGVLCDIVTQGIIACDGGGAIHDVPAYMYSAGVAISESAVPTVSNVGERCGAAGSLAERYRSTFAASDASGIREQAAQTSGGQTILSTVNGCDFVRSRRVRRVRARR